MKKHLLPFLLLILPVVLSAQPERMVLVEEFTNASCVPCDAQNPDFNALMLSPTNRSKSVLLKYQTSFPGFDPMNAHNPSEVLARRNYYGIGGVPTATIDGTIPGDSYAGGLGGWNVAGGGYAGGPYGFNDEVIDFAHNQPAVLEMEVDHQLSADLDSIFISGKIRNLGMDTFNATNTFLHVAVIEQELIFPIPPGSTSETDFYHVMRKMLPNANGVALDDIPNGDSVVFDYQAPLPDYIYDYSQIGVVSFVQTNGTRQVHQAALSETNGPPAGFADVALGLDVQKADGYCEYDVTPVAVITNESPTDVTRFEVDLLLDGTVSAIQTFENDTLREGESTEVVFPTIVVDPGESEFSFEVRGLNDSRDYNSLNELDNSTTLFTLSDEPFGQEIIEGFESTPNLEFPPNALIERPSTFFMAVIDNNVFSDVSQALGGYAESDKSIMVDFYLWDDVGAQSNLVYGKLDLSDRENTTLIFDYAFAQFSEFATNDRFLISVSEDCGNTWTTVYDEGGPGWVTAPASGPRFIPTASQWATDTVDLSAYDGIPELNIRFTAQTDWGNNLYFDNIVLTTDEVTSVNSVSLAEEQVFVYPNPANRQVNVDFSLRQTQQVHAAIFDAAGKAVFTLLDEVELGAGGHRLQWQPSAAGLYFLRIATEDGLITKRIVVNQ